MLDYSGLNKEQKEAVMTTEGPLLVIAGAGSGKTRVLTYRIAYLIDEKKVLPYNILAITFTNKAAKEMKSRVENMLPDLSNDMWISTFHSACVRILRKDIDKIGYDKRFVIFDTADQKTLVKDSMKELNIDEKEIPVQSILAEISKAKNALIETDEYINTYQSDYRLSKIAKVYELYQKKLRDNNALDFDDIIMKTINLFMSNSEVLNFYQRKFKYIMVDEYQDTNVAQFTLVSLLASGTGNLCVVGDDDQSIYGWRGADMRNILEFEKNFPGAKVIKLEQNYRSTSIILDAANGVIENNKGRKGKKLWTDNGRGEKINFCRLSNEYEEGSYIANIIRTTVRDSDKNYSDIGVLYRMNAQSRVIEEYLMSSGIPYKVVGGLKFYDRKEIKDIIAYLRTLYNPADFVSIKRILNVPKRGIGKTSIDNIQEYANGKNVSGWYVIEHIEEIQGLTRSVEAIKEFSEKIKELALKANQEGYLISDLIKDVINETGYLNELEIEDTVENRTRIENIMEFVSSAKEYEKEAESPTLSEFLENIVLVSEPEDEIIDENSVTLMTLHSAKGLEFPIVIMPGMEDGVFPSYRAMFEGDEVEEERRLCYVGITRAREKLYMSAASSRTLFGNTTCNKPSKFLEEIPEELLDGYEKEDENRQNRQYAEQATYSHQLGKGAASKYMSGMSGYTSEDEPVINDDTSCFAVGVNVMHRKFGFGIISAVEPEGDDLKLEIIFQKVGMKRLMAKYAQLEIV